MVSPSKRLLRLVLVLSLCLCGALVVFVVTLPLPALGSRPHEEALITHYDLLESMQEPFPDMLELQADESLANAFKRLGIQDPAMLDYLATSNIGRALSQPGKTSHVLFLNLDRNMGVHSILLPQPEANRGLVVQRDAAMRFVQRAVLIPFEHRTSLANGVVQSNLFDALDAEGLPDEFAPALVEVFAKRLDAHNTLHKGDRFTFVYDATYYNGAPVGNGKILAAELVVGGKHHVAARYGAGDNEGFYTPAGENLDRGMLRNPVEYSRISSSFSTAREHPLFGDIRQHTGVDFAAPEGSRVHATDAGVVEFVGTQTGYGNFIILSHGKGISTAYGHLSDFAAGLKKGMRVQQNQVIGYVGQTGWATGPHLHYEYRINGRFIDPETLPPPPAAALKGRQYNAFRTQTHQVLAQLAHNQPHIGALDD